MPRSRVAPHRDALLAHVARYGPTWEALGATVPLSPSAMRAYWNRHVRDTPEGKEALQRYEAETRKNAFARMEAKKPQDVFEVLDIPPKTLAVPPPAPVYVNTGQWRQAVLYGDSHHPFQDDRALAIVRAVIEDVKPNVICDMGDGVDAYPLSRFDKDPMRRHTLQDEIDAKRIQLAQYREAAPNAEYYYLEGNHEDRLRRAIWTLPDAAKALATLVSFQRAMTWPALLGLDELHCDWVPAHEQSRREILPKWILKHGQIVRKYSGYTARGEWERYGRSGSSGHTHRLGLFFHRDHNGNHAWAETGCTCTLSPEYVTDPDWQQGCWVVTFEKETGAFQPEVVYIHDGRAVWRERWVEA